MVSDTCFIMGHLFVKSTRNKVKLDIKILTGLKSEFYKIKKNDLRVTKSICLKIILVGFQYLFDDISF